MSRMNSLWKWLKTKYFKKELPIKPKEFKCKTCHDTGWDEMGYTLSCIDCNQSPMDAYTRSTFNKTNVKTSDQ